jgi:hypothetical protein
LLDHRAVDFFLHEVRHTVTTFCAAG